MQRAPTTRFRRLPRQRRRAKPPRFGGTLRTDSGLIPGLRPQQVMMVAAHNADLLAAKAVGFRAAFVYRTREYGPSQTTDLAPDPSVDIVARDFAELADIMA